MSLSTCIVNGTVSGTVNAFTRNPLSRDQAIQSNGKMPLTGKQVISKKDRFLEVLEKVSKENQNSLDLKPLDQIFQIMSHEENETVKQSLTKKQGFVVRFFSSESWDEWTQNKTALGRVASLFSEHLDGSIDLSCLRKRLNGKTIQAASDEATKVLKHTKPIQLLEDDSEEIAPALASLSICSEALFLGATASVLSQNPLPIGLAGLHCLTGVEAQRGNPNVAARNRIENHRSQIMARKARVIAESEAAKPKPPQGSIQKVDLELFDRSKEKLIEELGEAIPRILKRAEKVVSGNSWVDAIITGVAYFVTDVTQVDVPTSQLIAALTKLEVQYWYQIVYGKYIELFQTPNEGWNSSGVIDHNFVIKQMKDKLNSHGYSFAKFGTPIQFLEYLKHIGVCESAHCPRDEL